MSAPIPCPFCCWPDPRVKFNPDAGERGITFVICDCCGAVVSFAGAEATAEAIAAYNRRGPLSGTA